MKSFFRDNGRGLPRSLADDPFFQYHHQRNSPSAECFREFPPQHANGNSGSGRTRLFGSNPRLYDNVGPPFFDEFDAQNGNYGSLPRRHSQSRSPQPPSLASRERQVPVIHRQSQSIPLPPPSPQPPRKQQSEAEQVQQSQQQQKPPTVHVINVHPAVEINNSPPSSYTNGKLNPDRANTENLSAHSAEDLASDNSLSAVEVTRDTIGTPSSNQDSGIAPSLHLSSANSTDMNETEKRQKLAFERKTSVDVCGDQLIHLLDEAEARVEHLRDAASKLEIEKEQILDILSNLKLNSEILRLGEGERDDINATTDRILKRCKAVDVVVNTPRSEEQTRALDEVNNLIQSVVQKMQDDLNASKDDILQTVQRFLNACSPDEPSGPIDQRFQSKVVECTADDQKKIRRRLAQMITQIDRAERACVPNF